MIRVYTYEEIEQFFDHDTYGDMCDLLLDLINGNYNIESLRLDVQEFIEKFGDIDYD